MTGYQQRPNQAAVVGAKTPVVSPLGSETPLGTSDLSLSAPAGGLATSEAVEAGQTGSLNLPVF